MFNRKKQYYYGETDNNIVELLPAEADAVNRLRIREVPGQDNLFETNLTSKEMDHYGRAATKLNEYLEDHDVFASEEYLENNPILRLKK